MRPHTECVRKECSRQAEIWTSASPWFSAMYAAALFDVMSAAVLPGRGLHSSTFRLIASAFCGTEGAFRGCFGGVQVVLRWCYGVLRYLGCMLCQKRLKLS